MNTKEWIAQVVRQDEIDKYLVNGKDFIDEGKIVRELEETRSPDAGIVRDILQKSLEIKLLTPRETAVLLNVEDPELLEEMKAVALEVKNGFMTTESYFLPRSIVPMCVSTVVYIAVSGVIIARKRGMC